MASENKEFVSFATIFLYEEDGILRAHSSGNGACGEVADNLLQILKGTVENPVEQKEAE